MATNKSIKDLKVALVHDSLTIPGGAEKVLLEFHKLFPNAPIYTPFYIPENFPEFKDAKVIPTRLNRWRYLRHHYQMAFPLIPQAIEQFDMSGYDLVLSDSSAFAKGVITRPETIHVCYCQTPMRWAWMPYLDPRASSSALRRWTAHYLRIWDIASLSRVDHWIGNSKTIVSRIKKYYDRDAVAIYPAVEVEHVQPSTENQGYYLSVGRLVAQKRVDIIIEGAKKAGVELIIAGDGAERKKLEKLTGNDPTIKILGRVSDQTRDDLYKNCKAFIFASEEDFGIVPIEAMAYGKPVIAFGRGGAAETVIDRQTGLHFSEQTGDSVALAIKAFEDLHFDAAKIAEHAQTFSTSQFRKNIMAYLIEKLKVD